MTSKTPAVCPMNLYGAPPSGLSEASFEFQFRLAMRTNPLVWYLVAALLVSGCVAGPLAQIEGEVQRWHPVTLAFDGPETSEAGEPNPFRDFRLQVMFTHAESGRSYEVPVFYAADGNAAESSASAGVMPDGPNDNHAAARSEALWANLMAGGAGVECTSDTTIPTTTSPAKTGGALQSASVTSIDGGGTRSLGSPPSTPQQDWVVLVRRSEN